MKRMMYLVMAIAAFNFVNVFGLTSLDSNYKVETILSYPIVNNEGHPKDMVFDESGNLYMTNNFGNCYISKVTPDGKITRLIEGYSTMQDISYGKDTGFGSNLYYSNYGASQITRVGLDGTATNFCPVTLPISIGIDPTGNYGGDLYTGTRSGDIYRISETGAKSLFCTFSTPKDEWVWNLAFDTTGRYGGAMYASMNGSDTKDMDWNGIYKINPDGTKENFMPFWHPQRIAFDTTEGNLFGNDMFVGNYNMIYRTAPDGTLTQFLKDDNVFIRDFTFGPDGAMYVERFEPNGTVYIDRVSVVPEPASLGLLGLGFFMIRRRRAGTK